MTRRLLLALLVACGPTAPPSNGTARDPQGEPVGEEPPPAPTEEAGSGPPAAKGEPQPAAGKPDGPPILAAHNRLRADHCAPPLAWSQELVAASRKWARNLAAQGCAFEHNPDPRYGENLAYFRPPGSLSEEQVAAHWYKEIGRYNFKKPGFSMEAGHFTQLVWVGSRRLGCASVECGGGELWVCNYDPPGNMMGAFDDNVRRAGCK